ncbi:hypothetical protein LNV08_22745, partial [Paucibacter sp. TC2R-5]|uniref:hypothetical protein n=1 Tax=Paucibacter sp. TC2R-5 TaxID=2893555 RepID=UPI0021E420D2
GKKYDIPPEKTVDYLATPRLRAYPTHIHSFILNNYYLRQMSKYFHKLNKFQIALEQPDKIDSTPR